MSTPYPRGSEWRRWDLHVHSPLSILNNQFPHLPSGEPDWDAYISKLENTGCAVIGVTDYFTIDGYKVLRQQQQEKGRLQGIRILPNIEFRLDKIVASKKDGDQPRRLNFHVLFSDEVSPEVIEEHFLHDISFNYQGTPGDKNDQRKLKLANLTDLGERLISEHAAFKGKSPLYIGAMNAVVNLDHVVEILTSSQRFKDKYLLALADEFSNLIPWDSQDHQTRKLLLQQSDMLVTGNPANISWCLGQPPFESGPDEFRREFRTLKPCIHGSDAHSLTEIAHPCAKRGAPGHDCNPGTDCELRYCWIKADPTFEGLRQLLYEPAERVRIQPDDPTPPKSIYSLAELDVPGTKVNSELTISETDLPLNGGLIAVAGGRGSGKTALVDILAHCFVDRQYTEDRNSFVRRIADDAPNLSISLKFASGDQFSKTLSDGEFFEDSGIAYIAQGELERYIDEHSDLNEYIHSVIFESPAIKDSSAAFEYESLVQSTRSLQADLDAKNVVIDELERFTSDDVQQTLIKTGKQAKADTEDLKKRIAEAEAKLSAEKREVTTKKQEAVAVLKAQREKLVAARELLQDAIRSVDTDLGRAADTVTKLNTLVEQLKLGDPVAVPSYPDRDRLDKLSTITEARVREVVAQIEKNEKEIKSLAEDMREHARLLAKHLEVETKYKQYQAQWLQLKEQQKVASQERERRSLLLKQLFQSVVRQRQQYVKIIETFSEAKDQVLSDLDFIAELRFDADALIAASEELADNRQVQVLPSDKTPSVFAELLLDMKAVTTAGDDAAIDTVVTKIDGLSALLAPRLKKARSVTTLALYKALYRSYLSVRPTALYKNTSLDRLSLGQKATVLIKIYLAEGEKPIIIDSHDDHLDNEFIMDELVGSIRQARNYRQVIIASNNGNVVINSDADQLIVAQRKDGAISYISGSIEDPVIRDRAVRVLEGGEEAFRRRQEKYRLVGR